MSSASGILLAFAEKTDELFGNSFSHAQDSMMVTAPKASPILDPSVKIQVSIKWNDESMK